MTGVTFATHEQAMACLNCGLAGMTPEDHFPQEPGLWDPPLPAVRRDGRLGDRAARAARGRGVDSVSRYNRESAFFDGVHEFGCRHPRLDLVRCFLASCAASWLFGLPLLGMAAFDSLLGYVVAGACFWGALLLIDYLSWGGRHHAVGHADPER
jgi:hypothetical protein